MNQHEVVKAPTRSNMGGVFVTSTTVSAEQDTGSGTHKKQICFMTSTDDTYLLFDSKATMTDIVIADYAGDERCIGPFGPGIVYSFEVAGRSRYFTVIIEGQTDGRFCWWTDQ